MRVFSQLFHCRARRLLDKARASWLIFFFDFFCSRLFFFYYFFFDFFLCNSLFFVFILYLACLFLLFFLSRLFFRLCCFYNFCSFCFAFNFGSLFFCLCSFCSEVVIDVLDGARTPVFLVVVLFINKVWLQVLVFPQKNPQLLLAQASSFRQGIDVQQAIVGCRRSCRLGQDLAQFLENLPHRSLIIKFIAAGISQGRFELELHVDQVVDLLLGNLCQFCDLIH